MPAGHGDRRGAEQALANDTHQQQDISKGLGSRKSLVSVGSADPGLCFLALSPGSRQRPVTSSNRSAVSAPTLGSAALS